MPLAGNLTPIVRLLLVIVAFAAATPAGAQSWRIAAKAGQSPNRAVYLVDASTIRRAGDAVRFTTQSVFEQVNEARDFDRSLTVRDGSCSQHSSAIVQNSYYLAGTLLDTTANLQPPVVHEPETVLYGVIDTVCGLGEYESEATTDPEGTARAWFREN